MAEGKECIQHMCMVIGSHSREPHGFVMIEAPLPRFLGFHR